jgi:uncharacterized protein
MRRLVLDTNIFVAACFNGASSSARLLRSIGGGECQLVWDDATRRETEAVFRQIPRLEWATVAPLFRPEWEFKGETHPERFGHVPDAEDRKFAALAAASGALLVSNDRHLLAHNGTGFEVGTPAEAVAQWRKG